MQKLRVAIIQNDAKQDWQSNFDFILKTLQKAKKKKPHFIALPETFYYRGSARSFAKLAKEVTPYVLSELKAFAKKSRISILAGSVLEKSSSKKFYNTSYLISNQGRIAAKYRKIHLFYNKIPGAAVDETKHHCSGRKTVVGNVQGVKLGLSVCYDLRFPELYRELVKKGSQVLLVPANFTHKTGEAHWEELLRARAIENQAFVIAPGQVGRHPQTKILSFGRSLIIDPWGKVIARGSKSRQEIVFASLDLAFQRQLRRKFPVLQHRKI